MEVVAASTEAVVAGIGERLDTLNRIYRNFKNERNCHAAE
jgi:hypothetical protein